MKMKYLVGAMIIVFAVFTSSVFVYGFFTKQKLEANLSTAVPPAVQTVSPSDSITSSSAKTFTLSQVAAHSKPNDCWLVIENKVYDVGSFLNLHPGGLDVVVSFCGKDATTAFSNKGGRGSSHSQNAKNMLQKFLLGDLAK